MPVRGDSLQTPRLPGRARCEWTGKIGTHARHLPLRPARACHGLLGSSAAVLSEAGRPAPRAPRKSEIVSAGRAVAPYRRFQHPEFMTGSRARWAAWSRCSSRYVDSPPSDWVLGSGLAALIRGLRAHLHEPTRRALRTIESAAGRESKRSKPLTRDELRSCPDFCQKSPCLVFLHPHLRASFSTRSGRRTTELGRRFFEVKLSSIFLKKDS